MCDSIPTLNGPDTLRFQKGFHRTAQDLAADTIRARGGGVGGAVGTDGRDLGGGV